MSERGVHVGCSYRSIDVFPLRKGGGRKRHQAVCSCGWKGPLRQRAEKALEDRDAHELDLIPASATPNMIRTGDHVRIEEDIAGERGSFRTGRFVGTGLDAADSSTQLLFVQIGAGLHGFPAEATRLLQPTGGGEGLGE